MRIVSFNVLHGRSPADGVVDVARLVRAVGALDADLLALQEVDRFQPRSGGGDLTKDVAAAVGATDWRFAPTLMGTPGATRAADRAAALDAEAAYGISLVSRYPVIRWDEFALPQAPLRFPGLAPGGRTRVTLLPDEPRAVLVAVVDGPIGRLTVATTHLSTVPGWNAWQLRVLTRRLALYPGPRLLLGDLNLPGPLAARVSGWRSLGRVRTYPAGRPRVQLDHVLASGRLPPVLATRAPMSEVSDHRALVVDVGDVLDEPVTRSHRPEPRPA